MHITIYIAYVYTITNIVYLFIYSLKKKNFINLPTDVMERTKQKCMAL